MRKDNSSLAIKDEIFFQFLFIFSLSYYVQYCIESFIFVIFQKSQKPFLITGKRWPMYPPPPAGAEGGRKCKLQNY